MLPEELPVQPVKDARTPKCDEHYRDNQDRCHRCGHDFLTPEDRLKQGYW